MDDELKAVYDQIVQDRKLMKPSIQGDLESYNKIIQYEELIPHIPKFYYPNVAEEDFENAEFIVMDYIKGTGYKKIQVPNCENTDRIILNTSKEDRTDRIVFIDLDGIKKDFE